MDKYEKVEQMEAEQKIDLILDCLGADNFLDALINSIGWWDIEEYLDYIIRVNDLADTLDDDEE